MEVHELKTGDNARIGETEVFDNGDGTVDICEVIVHRVKCTRENLEESLKNTNDALSNAEKSRQLLIEGIEKLSKKPEEKK